MTEETEFRDIKFNINGFEDRRTLAAILADNGYSVRIESYTFLATTTCQVIVSVPIQEANHDKP